MCVFDSPTLNTTLTQLEYVKTLSEYKNTKYMESVECAITKASILAILTDDNKEKRMNREKETQIILQKNRDRAQIKSWMENVEKFELHHAWKKDADAYNQIFQHIKKSIIEKWIDRHKNKTLTSTVQILDKFTFSDDKTAFFKAIELMAWTTYYQD